MLIKREKSVIDWDVLEFKIIARTSFDFKYLRIDKEKKNISIQDGIFAQRKEQEISSEMIQSINRDIDKIQINKWKNRYLWDHRIVDCKYWELCLFKNATIIFKSEGHSIYPKKFNLLIDIYDRVV